VKQQPLPRRLHRVGVSDVSSEQKNIGGGVRGEILFKPLEVSQLKRKMGEVSIIVKNGFFNDLDYTFVYWRAKDTETAGGLSIALNYICNQFEPCLWFECDGDDDDEIDGMYNLVVVEREDTVEELVSTLYNLYGYMNVYVDNRCNKDEWVVLIEPQFVKTERAWVRSRQRRGERTCRVWWHMKEGRDKRVRIRSFGKGGLQLRTDRMVLTLIENDEPMGLPVDYRLNNIQLLTFDLHVKRITRE
jgi:hypothetical protein